MVLTGISRFFEQICTYESHYVLFHDEQMIFFLIL